MKIELAVDFDAMPTKIVGYWLTDPKTKNDTHVHTGEGGKNLTIAHDVDECMEDKASRLAVTVNEDKSITLQVVDKHTKQVTQHVVKPEVLNKELHEMLKRVRDASV